MEKDIYEPLTRDEVIKAVERKNPSRIPLIMAKWWGEGLTEQYGDRLKKFSKYPDDVVSLWIDPLNIESMNLSWKTNTKGAKDRICIIDEWSKLDEFIEKMPDPGKDPQFDAFMEQAKEAKKKNRYILFCFWRLFFERPWYLRGMENIMIDYYLEKENVHRLHSALSNHYTGLIMRAVAEFKPDGFFTSDDLGHQTQSMMSPETFNELIMPYYQKIGETVRKHKLHWWLHSCGNNTPLLPYLVEAGVNVFHPVQKGTMDEVFVAKTYGDRLTFLAGMDVQHTLQEKTPEEVRKEVRFLIDTFDRNDGGMCIAAGNGIVAGTPFENIDAFLDEAVSYGAKHRSKMNNY